MTRMPKGHVTMEFDMKRQTKVLGQVLRYMLKNYKFSFHGFSTLKSAIVDLGTGKTVTNSAGHELTGYFSKLFAAEERSKL